MDYIACPLICTAQLEAKFKRVIGKRSGRKRCGGVVRGRGVGDVAEVWREGEAEGHQGENN